MLQMVASKHAYTLCVSYHCGEKVRIAMGEIKKEMRLQYPDVVDNVWLMPSPARGDPSEWRPHRKEPCSCHEPLVGWLSQVGET